MTSRVRLTKEEHDLLESILAETINFCKSQQYADLVKAFCNTLEAKYNRWIQMGRSEKVINHFLERGDINTPAAETTAGKFISKSKHYKPVRDKHLTGNKLKAMSENILGKRSYTSGGSVANAAAVREDIMSKKMKLQTNAIKDSLNKKIKKNNNSKWLKKNSAKTGIIDPYLIWPMREDINEKEVIDAIRIAAHQKDVFVIDIRGYLKLMRDYEIWKEFLLAIANTNIFMIGLGEDSQCLKIEHLELFQDMIRTGQLAIKRFYIESNDPRRIELLRLRLVGPNPDKSIVTIFTDAKKEDKILWSSLANNKVRKTYPRLAWLFAPERIWVTDIANKLQMQKTVTTYETAQRFIKLKK
jgi:hypothetical protein